MAMLRSRGSGPLLLLHSAAIATATAIAVLLLAAGGVVVHVDLPVARAFSPSSASSSLLPIRVVLPLPLPPVLPVGGHADVSFRGQTTTRGAGIANLARRPFWRFGNVPCSSRRNRRKLGRSTLPALPFDEDGPIDKPSSREDNFDAKTTVALVGGQSLLVVVAVIAAALFGTPNLGLGSGFDLTTDAIRYGALATIPLFLLAYVLDFVEKKVPALQDVTKATQRSVLALLGRRRKPIVAFGTALALGTAAGLGEEMLFRGVLQTELSSRLGNGIALGLSSIIFGALHAVTPLYAALAGLASVFFGYLYVESQNLAVPIVCHGLYDVGALLWAHWTVTDMSYDEQSEIINWAGPDDPNGEGDKQ